MRTVFGTIAALALLLAAAPPARAYGVATHVWLAEEQANRLASADPSLSFLVHDRDARACFLYGAFFPDMRSVARQAAGLQDLRNELLGSGFVAAVNFSTEEVSTAFSELDTHGSAFLLTLIDRARATGDVRKLAFALGNLAHVMQDKHAQVIHIPSFVQGCGCGDLGVAPAQDPAHLAGWSPGSENELYFEGMGDFVRPPEVLAFLKDAPWRLAADPNVSYAFALELRRFYWESAVAYLAAVGRPAPSEKAIMNASRLMEVAMTFYPFFTTKEPIGDALRTFIDRYVQLHWWAAALNGILQTIVTNLTSGVDLFDLVGPIVTPMLGGEIGGRSPESEILYAFGRGGADAARVRAKYAQNPEFARLDVSRIADPQTYAAMSYEGAHVIALDGLLRGPASFFTDDARWPRFSKKVMRAAAIRSLMRSRGPEGAADAASLLVWDVRWEDAATGAALPDIELSRDAGKTLRTEVEVYGADMAPAPRVLRARLRAETASGAADPVLAERVVLLRAADLDLRSYAWRERPVIAVEWTIAPVAGAAGVYLELDERRLALSPASEAADALATTELSPLASLMQGRPHYDRHYATYGTDLSSIRMRP